MPKAIKEASKKVEYETLKEDKTIIQQMEEEWPHMTAEFRRLQREQYELFLHKQHDYGPGNISVGTQLQTPEEIRLSLIGLFFRMNDKIQRIKTLLLNNRESAVKDEPIDDAFLDVSNYGIIEFRTSASLTTNS